MSSPCVSDGSSDTWRFTRRKRELRTVQVMIAMYCRKHHPGAGASLCAQCTSLAGYATRRLERCVFGEAKPTCAKCTVHCYSAGRRRQIRVIMQWAGPRMLLKHPLLAVFHLLDGRRPPPVLPAGPIGQRDPGAAPGDTGES